MRAALLLVLCLAVPSVAAAQSQSQDRAATLADIQQELQVLYVNLQNMKRELSTTGPAQLPADKGALTDRVNALESEIRDLTGKTEELENRINKVVADGTNRIGDLQFRVTELEGGDTSKLGKTAPLGGAAASGSGGGSASSSSSGGFGSSGNSGGSGSFGGTSQPSAGPDLAIGEKADFDAASAMLAKGDAKGAVAAFDKFLGDYPQSPLTGAAQLARGQGLDKLNRTADAGRAYLAAYTATETSDPKIASAGLLGLGKSLATLNQTKEACVALRQVGTRYPGTPAAGSAQTLLGQQHCP